MAALREADRIERVPQDDGWYIMSGHYVYILPDRDVDHLDTRETMAFTEAIVRCGVKPGPKTPLGDLIWLG